MRDNSSATVMLRLEGMAVLAVSERDGELEYAIETTAATGWCPVCGAVGRLHGRRPTWVRDLPAGDRPVTLVWVKRIWRCVHRQCEQQTWTETHPQIRPRAAWTARARKQACRQVVRDGHSVAAVARDFGDGWAAVMAAVVDYGTRLVERADRVAAVTAVGVDETAFARVGLLMPITCGSGCAGTARHSGNVNHSADVGALWRFVMSAPILLWPSTIRRRAGQPPRPRPRAAMRTRRASSPGPRADRSRVTIR